MRRKVDFQEKNYEQPLYFPLHYSTKDKENLTKIVKTSFSSFDIALSNNFALRKI